MKTIKPLHEQWHGKAIVFLIFFAIALIYFIYLPVSYDFDGTVFSSYLRYALLKNDLTTALQPHHPLHLPLNYVSYKVLSFLFGYRVLEYFHLQLFSLLFGLLTLFLTYRLLSKHAPNSLLQSTIAVTGTVFLAVSYGIWYYSVEPEVHIVGLFFILTGMYLLFFKPSSASIDSLKISAGAALCFALAAGFHLTNGLITFSLLIIFLIEKKRFSKIFLFFSFYAGYIISGLLILQIFSPVGLLTHYKDQLVGKNPLAGYKVNYWSGSFSLKSLWESIQSVIHGLTPSHIPFPLTLITYGLFLGMMIIIFWSLFKDKNKKIYYRLFAWMLPYFIFFTFWDHRNTEFKLNVLLPVTILFILSSHQLYLTANKKIRAVIVILGAFLICFTATVNYRYYILPANQIENNRNYIIANAIGQSTPPNALIVIAGCGSDISIHNKIYISYFANRRTFILDWMLGRGFSIQNITDTLWAEKEKGIPIYFFSTVLKPGESVDRLLKNHSLTKDDYFQFISQMTASDTQTIPLPYGYYLLSL